jgi:hypothetical protein
MPTKRRQTLEKVARLAGSANVARIADLKAAQHLIGDTYPARLAWVIRFIAEDPTTWYPAVRAAHGDCLHMLVFGIVDYDNLPDPMTPEEVETLHRDLRDKLRKLLNPWPDGQLPMVSIPTEGQTEGLVRASAVGKKPAIFGTTHGQATAYTAVFQAVKNLILQAGHRLLACPACGTPFISVRKQEYCTPRCSQRTRNKNRVDKRPRKTKRRKGGK